MIRVLTGMTQETAGSVPPEMSLKIFVSGEMTFVVHSEPYRTGAITSKAFQRPPVLASFGV